VQARFVAPKLDVWICLVVDEVADQLLMTILRSGKEHFDTLSVQVLINYDIDYSNQKLLPFESSTRNIDA
jgi:hypothetical protein